MHLFLIYGVFCRLEGTKFEVVVQTEDQIELSFTRTWNFSLEGTVIPLNVDKRYVLIHCLVKQKIVHCKRLYLATDISVAKS